VETSSDASTTCVTHEQPLRLQPAIGDQWTLRTAVHVAVTDERGDTSNPLLLNPWHGGVEVVLPDLDLLLTPPPGSSTFVLCRS
jgi:hypothetical protein